MSFIGTYRLVNAIENGSYNSSTLNTALGTARTKSELTAAINNINTLTKLMNSEVAVPIILGSAIARAVVLAGDPSVLRLVLPFSTVYLTNVIANSTYWSEFININGMYNAVIRSQLATTLIQSSTQTYVFPMFKHVFTPMFADGTMTGAITKLVQSPTTGSVFGIYSTGVYRKKKNETSLIRTTLLSTGTINDICTTSEGYIVAVTGASPNVIYYSTDDGDSWTGITNPTNTAMNAVIDAPFGGGTRVVAVGASGNIATCLKSNMASWATATSGTANALNCLSYSSGTLVTGGASGTILTSTTGTAWTTRTSNLSTAGVVAIANDGSTKFVAVSASTGAVNSSYSTDTGSTWTAQLIGSASYGISSITKHSSGDWYIHQSGAAFGNGAYQSSTGVGAWTAITLPSNNTITGYVHSARGLLVISGQNSTGTIPAAVFHGKNTGSTNQMITQNYDGTIPYYSTGINQRAWILDDGIYFPGYYNASKYCVWTSALALP